MIFPRYSVICDSSNSIFHGSSGNEKMIFTFGLVINRGANSCNKSEIGAIF
jgi:hypothetical protein